MLRLYHNAMLRGMCGIAGILTFDGCPVDPHKLRVMTDAMAHRGPDGEGLWLDGTIGLGHRRLSIIDLSPEAAQPMQSSDGNLVIVFNGEIYNYRELADRLRAAGWPCRTRSDTEVILNLYQVYGADCVQHLRGMFAFALWDRRARELVLARDRVGIKPLYLLRTSTTLAFASEIKAIASAGLSELRVDWRALGRMMRFLVVPQPDTIFQDIRKLEPGRLLTSNASGDVRERTYWTPAPAATAERADEEGQLRLVESTLRDSVDCHLVADVPVGAFLSGGLDSSTVVALMRDLQPGQEIRAFSVEFPGLESFDEGPFARKVAQLKQIDFHSAPVQADFANDLEKIAWHLDEPFGISSAYATYYLARYAASELKVVLTGDGGDELFAGYDGYGNDLYLRKSIVGKLADFHGPLLRAASRTGLGRALLVQRVLPGLLRRSGSEGLRYSEQVSQNSLGALALALRPEAFVRCVQHWSDNLVAKYYDELSSPDRLARKLYADYRTRLVDEMLMKVDRMTMAHSLEARVPLLDHKLVERAFQLPSTMKRRPRDGGGYESKYVIKRVMEKYLPRDIVYREKHGFNVPVGVWMRNGVRERIAERLLGGALHTAGIISTRGVRRLLDEAGGNAHGNQGMLMALVALESWAEAYQQRVGRICWG